MPAVAVMQSSKSTRYLVVQFDYDCSRDLTPHPNIGGLGVGNSAFGKEKR